MVRDLNLPVEHGDSSLLKKLQALGLHSNRYADVISRKAVSQVPSGTGSQR